MRVLFDLGMPVLLREALNILPRGDSKWRRRVMKRRAVWPRRFADGHGLLALFHL